MAYPSFESEKSFDVAADDVWAGDVCARGAFADRLKSVIGRQNDSCVIGLNGPWGSGKTYFLERFVAELRRDGKCCIFLNAWKHDWINNPLLDLHRAIWHFIEAECPVDVFDPAAKTMLSQIAWGVVKAVANHYTKGALDAVLKGVEKASEEDARTVFDKQSHLSNELKEGLSKIGLAIFDKTRFPLVICVDELDRCRPTYAIELLERVKHFFDVPYVVFVLGYDLLQLSASVRSVYGEIDAETYLGKFVTVDLRLSEISPVRLIELFWERYDLAACLSGSLGPFCKVLFQNLTRELHFSIRDMRRIFQLVQLGLTERPLPIISILVCVLSVLKIKSPAVYARYIGVRSVDRYEVMAALFPRAMKGYEQSGFKIEDKFLRELSSAIDISLIEVFDYQNVFTKERIARQYMEGSWEACEMINHFIQAELSAILNNQEFDARHCLVEVAAEKIDLNAYWQTMEEA